ncbi:MAG: hypothetical protein M3315_09380 [Actinomycetota bacterium]|nr:hypothetical protein [Actinomycetota bacterium]
MRSNADSSPLDQPIERRLNVHQAAEALGITPEAVRSRIQRGTLIKEKDEDGTVYVRLNADQLGANAADERTDRSSSVADETVDRSQLVERMAAEIEHLREMLALRDEEIRRRDHLLAAALERIPALESPPGTPSSEPREPPVRSSEEGRKGERKDEEEPPEVEPRSWWQRWFGV